MKTSIKTSAVLATALFAGVFAVGNAFTATTTQTASAIPTVVITAQRMSEDQKIAFDAQQTGVQTVVISAKRLSAEQKIAMDNETLNVQRVALTTNHRAAI